MIPLYPPMWLHPQIQKLSHFIARAGISCLNSCVNDVIDTNRSGSKIKQYYHNIKQYNHLSP